MNRSLLKAVIDLQRPKKWLKNLLILLPAAIHFPQGLNSPLLWITLGCFSLITGWVYMFNDYHDKEEDRKHIYKKYRPIPNNKISEKLCFTLLCIQFFIVFSLTFLAVGFSAPIAVYVVLSVCYTLHLKHMRYMDLITLICLHALRLTIGYSLLPIEVNTIDQGSLYSLLIFMALPLSLSKRIESIDSTNKENKSIYTARSKKIFKRTIKISLPVCFFIALTLITQTDSFLAWVLLSTSMAIVHYFFTSVRPATANGTCFFERSLKSKLLWMLIGCYISLALSTHYLVITPCPIG